MCMHTHTHAHAHAHTHTNTYAHTHTCTCMLKHTHTLTHTLCWTGARVAQKCRHTRIIRGMVSRAHGFSDIWLLGHAVSEAHGLSGTWLHSDLLLLPWGPLLTLPKHTLSLCAPSRWPHSKMGHSPPRPVVHRAVPLSSPARPPYLLPLSCKCPATPYS